MTHSKHWTSGSVHANPVVGRLRSHFLESFMNVLQQPENSLAFIVLPKVCMKVGSSEVARHEQRFQSATGCKHARR